jgi:vancomycin resistance protein YoaR
MMSRRRLVAGSLGAMIAGAAVAVPASTSGQIYPGTTVHGIDVSHLSPQAGEALLRATLAPLEHHAVTYTFEGRSWEASLAAIGMEIDYDAMIASAMAHGRDGTVLDRYSEWLEAGGRDVPLVLNRDEAMLRSVLEGIGEEVAILPVDARLIADESGVAVVNGEQGRELDIERAIADTLREVCDARTAAVVLATSSVAPAVTADDLDGAGRAAERLVAEPVVFAHEGLPYPIEPDDLLTALVIGDDSEPRLDAGALAHRLDEIAAAVIVPARNVMLGWSDGPYVVADDVDGWEVDRKTLESALLALAASDTRSGPLPMRSVPAAARADTIEELGLDTHIASGSSSFAGSSDSRHANVVVSAENISYKLVSPGGRFSFNELLGPITEENGFVSGTIIQGNWEASDIGGGVCQVSTTVFRAAANAGFRFEEWHPHSWRLAFYEADGSPPGFDGAIYQPNTPDEWEKDLVFENPLDSWLLLIMEIDGAAVSAHFYGRDPGWTVEMGEARLSDPKPIPEPVERENPDIAPGERVKVRNANAGVTVSIRRTVTATDGTVMADGDFVSDYRSVPEAWEVGTV